AGWLLGAAVVAALLYLTRLLLRWGARAEDADSVRGENQTPASVDALPSSSDFVLTAELDIRSIDPRRPPDPATLGGADSVQATRFKAGLRDAYTALQNGAEVGRKPERVGFDVAATAVAAVAALDPAVTTPSFVLGRIEIPAHGVSLIGQTFVESMAYPELDIPIYEPLARKSADMFVPNLNFIEQN